jgi:hypothetical protein
MLNFRNCSTTLQSMECFLNSGDYVSSTSSTNGSSDSQSILEKLALEEAESEACELARLTPPYGMFFIM